jgi:hypothetical protein
MPTHYEISSAIHPGKQLTAAQRSSSQFQEAPQVGGIILRKGKTIKVSTSLFHQLQLQVKRHLASGSIEVIEVDEDTGARHPITTLGAPPAAVFAPKPSTKDEDVLKQEAEKAIEEAGEPVVEPVVAPVEEETTAPEEIEAAPEVVQEEVQADTVAETPKSKKRR